jgi:hypothetical protein
VPEQVTFELAFQLRDRVGTEKQFTDSFYYDASTGENPSTVTVDGDGTISQQPANNPAEYTCAYSLLR